MISLKRKEGESVNSFLYRFFKRVQRSGVTKESKKRRYSDRTPNKRARKDSALYRIARKKEIERERKLGIR